MSKLNKNNFKPLNRIPIKNVCDIFDGPHATPKKTTTGPVYLGIDAITADGKLDSKKFEHLSDKDYITWTKRVTPEEGDIVFSYEATLGRYAIIPPNFYGSLGRRLAIIRNKSSYINTEWLYYYFRSPEWTAFIKSKEIKGSTVNRISVEDFPEYTIPLISLDEQKKIADILATIDKKINNNTKINDNLAKQMQTLYDYWFTQYDFPDENGNPYCSSGGEMVYNEILKQKIPNGWHAIEVRKIAKIKSGYAFSSENYSQNGKYRLITIKNVKNEGINLNVDNFIETIPNNMPEYCKLNTGDILMSLTGNVGRVGIMFSEKCLLNQRVAVIKPLNSENKFFIYNLFKGKYMKASLLNLANGSSQANLSPVETEKIKVAYNRETAVKFNNSIQPLINELIRNLQEIQKLSQVRDWLLPVLMNGQATISK